MEVNNDPCYKVTKSHVSESKKYQKGNPKDPFSFVKRDTKP